MKHSILIVDDEEVICKGLSRVFSQGYKTYTARSGIEALNIVKENNGIDVMLCDLMMPVMEGGELIEKIRANNKDIYVILVTAATSVEVCDAMKKGANYFISKPFDVGHIENLVSKYVNSRTDWYRMNN